MDIHRPKPFHGMREFLKEYGIIVLGVLTALLLEQAVDWLHWTHDVHTEREALLKEVRANASTAYDRVLEQPCIEKRLSELMTVFQRHDEGRPLGVVGRVGAPLEIWGDNGTWSMAVAGGGLNHMPLAERTAFSDAFANYDAGWRILHDERTAWLPLGVLDHAGSLRDADWAMLRIAFAQARAASDEAAHIAPFMLRGSATGQNPEGNASVAGVFKAAGFGSEICKPLLSP